MIISAAYNYVIADRRIYQLLRNHSIIDNFRMFIKKLMHKVDELEYIL